NPRRHGQVRAEHARVAENSELVDAAVKRRVASFRQAGGLGEHLRHHRPRLDTFHEKRAEVTMKRADEVLSSKRETGADDDGFLADARVDPAPDLALTHEDAEALVERAHQLQPAEHVEKLLGRKLELRPLDWRHGGSRNRV